MTEVDVEEIEPTSYTSESTPSKATSTVDRPAKTAPAGATGRRKGWKKAYVSLKAGQEINFVEGGNA